ncbi:MAG TPA: GntR family transcriptional regulator [Devosiaceae bacterium]
MGVVTRQPRREAATWRLIYQSVRERIVAVEMQPGDKISENELAQLHGVSRTPVREAMQRLADEGLVEIFPQSGTFVARIPYEELPEAMVIRKALENTTATIAAGRATRSQILTLASIIEQQREAAAASDRSAFHRADELFHAKLAEIAGYPGIWRLVLQVKTQVDRFRQLTLILPRRMFAVIEEHEQVLRAIEKADPQAAAEAMMHHLDSVLPAVEQVQHNDGENA